ncbi:M48 family metalloprotease [Nocardia sp. NPDC019395]|uniref:M48 family metallopeptidase n=1 Tax=Nocardia sp. NPDC019395 TaxID=3154686 RepID=UPI0033EA0A69
MCGTDRPVARVAVAGDSSTSVIPVRARVFAAGTAIRFALLLSFIVVDSLSLLSSAAATYRGGDRTWSELCRLAVGYDMTQQYKSAEMLGSLAFIESCEASHGVRPPVWWMAFGTAAVFVVAAAIYLLLPTWRHRRGGPLLTVDLGSSDELAHQLRELVAIAALPKTPRFVIDPRADAVSAVVFGRLGRYSVCLTAGLVARSATDPGVLRDVVLHELAHIRNRDVDITYATVALWRALLICVVIPYVLGDLVSLATHPEVWRAHWELGVRSVVRVAVLLAMTFLVRADILRNREYYADADAARIAGPDAFSWRNRQPRSRPRFVGWQRFLGLWRTHPGWPERERSLTDPAGLSAATALPMFLTGLTAQVASLALPTMSAGFGWNWRTDLIDDLSVWLSASLVVGIAGYILWRAVGYAVLTARPVPSGWGAGVWLAVGMAVGELVSFRTAGDELLPPQPEILLAFAVTGPIFAWWVTQCAELWIRGCRGRSIRPVQVLGLSTALVVFGTWYGYWMSGPFLLLIGPIRSEQLTVPGTPPWFFLLADLANRPMVFVGAAVLWVFPLLAAVRRPVTETPIWVRQAHDLASPDDNTRTQAAMPIRRVAVASTVGGVLCISAIVLVMVSLHPHQPPLGQMTDEWVFTYPLRSMAGLGAALVLTAATVAATTSRFRLVTALAAAGGAGLIGLLGLFLLAALDGCIEPMQVMGYSCRWRPDAAWQVVTLQVPFVLGLGIYLAAIGALVGAVIVDGVRRVAARRGRPVADEGAVRPESLSVRRLVVVVACGSVLALGANTAINYYNRAEPPPGAELTFGNKPPRTADMIQQQVWAWLRVGGHDRIARFSVGFQQWATASGDAVRAAEQAGLPSVPIDPAIFVPICSAIVRDAEESMAFIPIPDDEAQRAWSTSSTMAARAGTDCRDGIQDGNAELFNGSLSAGLSARTAYDALLTRLNTLDVLDTDR